MKALFLIGLVVAFILSGLWFISSEIDKSNPENVAKQYEKKDKETRKSQKKEEQKKKNKNEVDYAALAKRNNELMKMNDEMIKTNSTQEEETDNSPSITDLLDSEPEEEKHIQNMDEVLQEIGNEQVSKYAGNLSFKIKEKKLAGSKKNVLMVSFSIENKTNLDIREKDSLTCTTYSPDNEILDKKKVDYEFSLRAGESQSHDNKIIGIVDNFTENIVCELEQKNKDDIKYEKEKKEEPKTEGDNLIDLLD